MTLVLASQSPRRAELLRQAGIPFVVRAAPVEEVALPGEPAESFVSRLAWEKAHAGEMRADEWILAADTTVLVDGTVLGKPQNHADARRMLQLLSGREHSVLTGVCLRAAAHTAREVARTRVWFAPLEAAEIERYAATGEPMDKAGAYAIQGIASRYVERIDGSYSNVVGLPVEVVYRLLRKAGLPC